MAMIPNDEAIVFTQNNKSEPKSLIQDKSVSNTTKKTGSFLVTHDLAQFRNSALFASLACQPEMKRRRELSEGLLAPVFNANPAEVDAFFKQPNAKKEMILAKSCYREGYQSKKQNKFVVFRNWKSVSSLQAAALCLDKFLVIKLLAQIVADDTLRLEAKKQLEEIRNRIVIDHKEKQESINSAAKVTSVSSPIPDSSNGDRKRIDEKAQQNTSADFSEYGAPIKALLKAYSNYLTQYPSLSSQDNWDELDKLWDVVGSCHKRLPRYVLQEIFKDKRWSDDSNFSLEPPRNELRYWDKNLLDLDGLGDGTLIGLYKGPLVGGDALVREGVPLFVWHWRAVLAAQIDSAAFSRLCELRINDLENIIDALQTPEESRNKIIQSIRDKMSLLSGESLPASKEDQGDSKNASENLVQRNSNQEGRSDSKEIAGNLLQNNSKLLNRKENVKSDLLKIYEDILGDCKKLAENKENQDIAHHLREEALSMLCKRGFAPVASFDEGKPVSEGEHVVPLSLNQLNFCKSLLKEIDLVTGFSEKYKISLSHALRECTHFMIDRLYEPKGLTAVCLIITKVNNEPLQSYNVSIDVIDNFLARLASEDNFIKESLMKLKEDRTTIKEVSQYITKLLDGQEKQKLDHEKSSFKS